MSSTAYLWVSLGAAVITALGGVVAGVLLSASPRQMRVAIPLSAGLLLGVAIFGLLPELAHDLSWTLGILFFAIGFLVLTLLDRIGVAICPDCSHDHEHADCEAPLHGFATPLLAAVGIHALFDGWAIAVSGLNSSSGVRIALPLALVLHKVPEGLALGGILKPAVRSRWTAISLAMSAELLTIAGGGLAVILEKRLGSAWTNYPLALAGGFFLFLAFHALHGEWRRGRRSALLTGLAGLAVSAMLQSGVRSYFGA